MATLLGYFMNSNYFVKGKAFVFLGFFLSLCSYAFQTFLKHTTHIYFTCDLSCYILFLPVFRQHLKMRFFFLNFKAYKD